MDLCYSVVHFLPLPVLFDSFLSSLAAFLASLFKLLRVSTLFLSLVCLFEKEPAKKPIIWFYSLGHGPQLTVLFIPLKE